MTKQVILGAHFPGVNNHTVWSDPAAGSQIAFSSFAHLARTAEAGLFDFFFLAEGLRLREQGGKIHDLDVAGRPNTMTVLAAVAAVTEHLGLAGTIQATYNEPYEIARQFATLDHLSGGRAAWNVVTSPDAFTGENFGRGGYLDRGDRYVRAAEFVQACRELWESWEGDAIAADPARGEFTRPGASRGRFEYSNANFGISGNFSVPRSPQVHPVILQAGDSDGGREFAAHSADAIFTRHSTYDAGRVFYADVKSRLARYGRPPGSLKVLPGASFVLGDTPAEAEERARHIRRQQVSPQTAILMLEQVWNADLSSFDAEGPLPPFDPDPEAPSIIQGRARMYDDPVAVARKWRAIAEEQSLSIRDLIIEVTGRQTFTGTPASVAAEINRSVQDDACDGFILVPHLIPAGLDEFAAKVVPLSILDLSPVVEGATPAAALRNTLDLARRAEDLGYLRYWVAEHHFAPGVASSSPAVLIAAIAAVTSRIRVGAGAVQLGHQTAAGVVEAFGTLSGLYPGRIDLGLGRSGQKRQEAAREAAAGGALPPAPSAAPRTVNGLLIPGRFSIANLIKSPRFAVQDALIQQPGAQTPDFGEQVRDILAFLGGTYRTDSGLSVEAVPGAGADAQVWILGSSAGQSAQVAGALGLPFAANYHVSPATVLEAVAAYRAAFRPSAVLAAPYVQVSADVVVAPTDGEARELASGYGLWVRSIRTGAGAMRYPSPASAAGFEWTDEDRALVSDRVDTQFAGSPATVAKQLRVLQDATGADELLVTTITYSHADRVRSFELLAREWGQA